MFIRKNETLSDKKEAEKKLAGQRSAIESHVNKYRFYNHDYDKKFALKTISNCQREIIDIKKRNPGTSVSPWDNWKP